MVSISDIQNGSYHWETEVSHANNIGKYIRFYRK